MNPFLSLEKKLRTASFPSMSAARDGLVSHPLAADYLLSLLVDRGVLRINDDGSVAGTGERIQRGEPKKPAETREWQDRWPQRYNLACALEPADDCPPFRFRDVQNALMNYNDVHSHWLTLHAIWWLMKIGHAQKRGDAYELTPDGIEWLKAERASRGASFAEILKAVGAPYPADVVNARVQAHPVLSKDCDYAALDQAYIDHCVKSRLGT